MAEEPQYNHNKTLFTKENQPLIFFLRPCRDKTKIKPLVEHGGGKILSKFITGSIKLAQSGDIVSSTEYVSTKYILDCVKENKLLDITDYKMKRQSRKFNIEDAEELSNVSDDLSPSSSVLMEAKNIKGRSKYTDEEDMAMLNYIISEGRQSHVQGMQLYKDMELLKITNHTASSMNSRLRKTILHTMDKYDIPEKQRRMISPYYSPRPSPKGKPGKPESKGAETSSIYFAKPANKTSEGTPPSEDNSVMSEDDFDRQLQNLAKEKEKAVNSTPAKNKELCVDLSNSIISLDKDGKPEVQKNRNNSKHEKVTELDTDKDSSEDMDTSLVYRHVQEEKSKVHQFVKPKSVSPVKRLWDEMHKSPEKDKVHPIKVSKKTTDSRTRYILEEESNTSEMSEDEESIYTEVNKLEKLITRLGDIYGLLDEEIYHILLQHDGNVTETIKYIETGHSDITWSLEDDRDLQSNNNQERLNSVYSKTRIRQRAAFLE